MNLTRELLQSVYSKTQGLCWYCGSHLPPFSDWQVDHQIPKRQRGSDELSNLVPACRACNARKGGRTVEQFRHGILLKLEHAVSHAWEIVEEVEPLITAYNYPESIVPLSQTLALCANTVVGVKLEFYGERLAHRTLEPPMIQESEGAAS